MSKSTVVIGLLAYAALATARDAHGQTAAARCAELTKLQVPGVALAITKAEWLSASSGAAPAGAPARAALPAYAASTA